MRAQKSAKNIIVALISNALNIVLGVVVQSIFLKTFPVILAFIFPFLIITLSLFILNDLVSARV